MNLTSISINATYLKLSWEFYVPKLFKSKISNIVYIRSSNEYVFNITVQEPEVIVAIPDLCITYTATIVSLSYNSVKRLSRMLIRAKPGIYTLYGRYGGTDVW